jgi:PAS domain S-box-containing protein
MEYEGKKHILLVEDSAIIAMAEKMELEQKGYRVHHVTSGEKAIESFSKMELNIDLVLMDIDLGSGIDGTQAAREILSENDIPIVFLSSHTELEVVEKTEKISSYGYVVKDSGIIILDASIKMALKLFHEKMKHKQTEKELREREKVFHVLFEGSVRPLLLIKDGLFYECNNAALHFLGINDKELFIGSNPDEISPEIQPDGRRSSIAAEEYINKALTEGFCLFEWMCVRYDGTPFLLEVTLLKITLNQEDILHVTWYDITERKKAEQALRINEDRLSKIHHAANDGMWDWDLKSNDVYFDPRYYEMAGYSANEFDASFEAFQERVHPEDLANVLSQVEKHLHGETERYKVEFRFKKKNGEWMWIAGRGIIVERAEDGTPTRFIGTHQDITERKEAEKEIQKQLAEKETLLKEVHHRVKNNIQNIESYLMLQQDSTNNSEAKKILIDAISRVQSMRILYDRLLLSEDQQEIPIKNYIHNLIDSIQNIFSEKKQISIHKQIDEFNILANSAITLGIIINELLTNAFKYAFPKKAQGTISLSIKKIGNQVTVIVHDNGIGIDDTIQKNTSSGFGLTIVKMLVEQLNGTYTAEKDNGTKSIIHFLI